MDPEQPLIKARSGASHRTLERWIEVLDEMHAVIERYRERTGEVPWRWGERALVSFLTAAIWLRGGVALEEFSTIKKDPEDRRRRVGGRADLWADLNGTSFTIEAKVARSGFRRRGAANTGLSRAIVDAKHTTTGYANHRLALLFVEWRGDRSEDTDGDEEREGWFAEVASAGRAAGAHATLCAVHIPPPDDDEAGWGYGVALVLF